MQFNFIKTIMVHFRKLVVIMLCSLSACEPTVTFQEPQPTGSANLSAFPTSWQGRYTSLTDSNTLLIGEKLIQRICFFEERVPKSQLDSISGLYKDTLSFPKSPIQVTIHSEGDSLLVQQTYTDTLFYISNEHILRKMQGNYFINIYHENTGWEVKKFQLSKGKLLIGAISTPEEINTLNALTKSTPDSIAPHQFSVTRRQFKSFVKGNGFQEQEIFLKNKN